MSLVTSGSVDARAESVFNSKIDETVPWHQRAVGCAGVYGGPWGVRVSMGGQAKLKRCVFRSFLKVATDMADRTDSGRLLQRDRTQE